MKINDENDFKSLLSKIKIEETVSGGSVANSIVGLSQLGNNVGFIGKINDDSLGEKYEKGLHKEKVKFLYSKKKESLSTGTCDIDDRLWKNNCTFLGTAGKISDNDISENEIKKSEITFLEGYLWDKGDPRKAFDKAIQSSNKVAMSLSDLFCVERHKDDFLDLVKNKIDITFANEQEILALINAKSFNEVISFVKQIKKHVVITRGSNGSIVIKNEKVFECKAKTNLNIVDLTGAGDLFAAGYLHGQLNDLGIEKSLDKGTILSSKIIQTIGARF